MKEEGLIVHILAGLITYRDDLEIIETIPSFPSIETSLSKSAGKQLLRFNKKQLKQFQMNTGRFLYFLMLQRCRTREAAALKCKDIKLKQETIIISSTFSGRVYREKRKGRNAKYLNIPIHPEITLCIQERVESNLSELFLFVKPSMNKYYLEIKLRKIWEVVRKKVGMEKSIHISDASRHSFASQLINKGVSFFNVSKILCHSNTKKTEI